MFKFTMLLGAVATTLAVTSTIACAQSSGATNADAEFLKTYAATYRFRLGRPTSIKPAPDGETILFLRSGPRSDSSPDRRRGNQSSLS